MWAWTSYGSQIKEQLKGKLKTMNVIWECVRSPHMSSYHTTSKSIIWLEPHTVIPGWKWWPCHVRELCRSQSFTPQRRNSRVWARLPQQHLRTKNYFMVFFTRHDYAGLYQCSIIETLTVLSQSSDTCCWRGQMRTHSRVPSPTLPSREKGSYF